MSVSAHPALAASIAQQTALCKQPKFVWLGATVLLEHPFSPILSYAPLELIVLQVVTHLRSVMKARIRMRLAKTTVRLVHLAVIVSATPQLLLRVLLVATVPEEPDSPLSICVPMAHTVTTQV